MQLKRNILIGLSPLFIVSMAAIGSVDLKPVVTVDLHQTLGQLRAVPVSLGAGASPAALVVYGQDAEIDPYTSIPVDLDGDGVHELVKGYFEGDGSVLDREGSVLGNIGGLAAMCSKFTEYPGEQILSFSNDGKVRVWADVNAVDQQAARKRYQDRFYYTNQRMTACGYNLFTLGGF